MMRQDKYPAFVKTELARFVHYEFVPTGTLVLRQGDPGHNFYFIISGKVAVSRFDNHMQQKIQELGKGEAFGELALLDEKCRRTASITTLAATEFLSINSWEYNQVLRASHCREQEQKFSILRSHAFFQDWPDVELHESLSSCQLREFQPGALICDGIRSNLKTDCVFILVAGGCQLLRKMPQSTIYPQTSALSASLTPAAQHFVMLSTNLSVPRHAIFTCW